MTVVASGLDGRLFDNTVPRFLYAASGLVFDRLAGGYEDHARLIALGLSGEIGAQPAGYGLVFDYAGEGSNAPLTATITGVGTTTVVVTFAGGPLNSDMVFAGIFDLAGTGRHTTAQVTATKGMTATQCAALFGPACDALPDITETTVGAVCTLTCSAVCTYASVVSKGGTTGPFSVRDAEDAEDADDPKPTKHSKKHHKEADA